MSQPSQADIFAALQAQASSSRKNRPQTKTYEEFTGDESVLIEGQGKENARRLYCPRRECASLILLPNTATLVQGPKDLIPIEEGSPFKRTQSDATSDGKQDYWHIKGGPMAFENIGYSRSTTSSLPLDAPGNSEGRKVKWLICAECDLGPLGWSFEGGNESWLDVARVGYAA